MIQYHYTDPYQQELCEAFESLTHQFPEIEFFQPSPEKAPWHVQAILHSEPEPIIFNFWPHKEKGQRQPFPAVEGIYAIEALIYEALEDAAEPDTFEVFE